MNSDTACSTPSSGRPRPVWLVTDQLPHPPRNGTTLPVVHYLEGLRRRHEVRLIVLVDAAHPPSRDELSANEARYGPITMVPLIRGARLACAADELLRRDMYYYRWRLAPGSAPLPPPPEAALVVSPMSAVAKWRRLKRPGHVAAGVSIAAVNDCTAAQYHCRGKQSFGGVRLKWRGAMDRWRAAGIAQIERDILGEYDHVLLQTPADLDWMRRLVGETIARRVTLAPNGVRAAFLSVAPDRQSRQIAWVGELGGEYASVARWLIGEVWPEVLRKRPEATLLVVGQGADDRLKDLISRTPRVSHRTYVEDLLSVYRESAAAACPIFKGYGLINKTLEAMASSVPVVGGSSAFNGIEGFEPGRDGVLCETRNATCFAEAIAGLVQNPALCARIGESGRLRVRDQFVWNRTVATLESLLGEEPATASSPALRDGGV